ncbi:bifunctional nuclease family protein [Thermovibrio sp.]
MVEVSVIGITQDRFSGMPIIILGNEKERFAVPIWVGNWEAELLETELLGAVPPRPFPYDLIRELLAIFKGEVERVVINDFDKGIYFAVIEVKRPDGEIIKVDSRPSDAINLAVRVKAPIFVERKVIEKASVIPLDECQGQECKEQWERLIKELFEE